MLQHTLIALDLALLLGVTLRLTRLVITDDLGKVMVRPAYRLAGRFGWLKAAHGLLTCPFCIGFWIGAAALASLALVGGPGADGHAALVWRYVTAAFTLNWVAAHIGSRLGDAGYADDE